MGAFLERAVEVFAKLCDLEPAEQQRRLAAITKEAPELGAKVAQMLEDDRDPDQRLTHNAVDLIGSDWISKDSAEAVSPEVLERLADRGRFGHYRVKGEVARGGMGSIFEVWDDDLERPLAMKVVGEEPSARERNGSSQVDADRLRRFLNEARVTSQLDHPGIVPVHEMGIDSAGRAYFTMKLVTGRTLGEIFEQVARGEDGWNQTRAVGVLLRVCEAMAYAHEKGVVHRDLKPANVMVGRMGEVYVMDWGVARVRGSEGARDLRPQDPALEARAAHELRLHSPVVTLDGMVVGTPYFMSPEQARGEEVDERSDVYAVGAMLYTLIAGHAPYRGAGQGGEQATPYGVLSAVKSGPPRSLQSLGCKAPTELEAICEKAMQRKASKRYASMVELREDLKAFLEGRVVHAYETGAGAEFRKWVSRNRGMATSLGAAIVLALGGLSATTLIQGRSNQLLAAQKDRAERNAYVSDVIAAGLTLDSSLTSARRRLERCPQRLRNWEWRHLDVRQDASLFTLRHGDIVSAIALAPDGDRFASAAADHRVRVWETRTGELACTLDAEVASPIAIDFSPDGRRLVSGSGDGHVQVWNARTGSLMLELEADNQWCMSVAFSPDGRLVAAGGGTGIVRLWDSASGDVLAKLTGHTDRVRSIVFSPDGSKLASGSYDHSVRIWDVAQGTLIGAPLEGHTGMVDSLAFSPDGTIVASGSYDNTVRTWSAADAKPLHTFEGHQDKVWEIAFSPDGTRLASASGDHTVRIWNVAGGHFEHSLPHAEKVPCISYSPDGTRLAAASEKSVHLWDTDTGQQVSVLRGHDAWIERVAFSPDGRHIVSCSGDETVRIWLSTTEDGTTTLRGHDDWIESVAYSPDGRRIASGSRDATVRVWDTGTGTARILSGHEGVVRSVAFSPEGDRIASGSHDKTVRFWSAETGMSIGAPLQHPDAVLAVAFSPRTEWLATGSTDGRIRVWGQDSICRVTLEGHTDSVLCVSFSRDGEQVLSGSLDGTLRIWDIERARAIAVLDSKASRITSVAAHPDGVRVLTGSWMGELQLWDPALPDPIAVMHENDSPITTVGFSPDGSRIASGSIDKTVRLWDAQSGDLVGRLEHPDPITALAWSPDGSRIATGSSDVHYELRIWESDLHSAQALWAATAQTATLR